MQYIITLCFKKAKLFHLPFSEDKSLFAAAVLLNSVDNYGISVYLDLVHLPFPSVIEHSFR